MPERIQRKRTKGWRMPEGAVYVGRPTIFGNPFRPAMHQGTWQVIDDNGMNYPLPTERPSRTRAAIYAVGLFADDLTYWFGGRISMDDNLAAAIAGLRGKDLACWCPLDQPCHADVLIDIANPRPKD
jgi:hypothetical protein